MIRNTQRGGIICASCIDSTIESNTMHHVAATGISLSGQRITVRANLVEAPVAGDEDDADGVRFFGNGHRIIRNTIRDISAGGYPAPRAPPVFRHLTPAAQPPSTSSSWAMPARTSTSTV